MRSIKNRLFALAVITSIMVTLLNHFMAKAVTLTKIDGVDYGRIYMNVRKYDVTAKVGGFVFPGHIYREADFDETEVNKYISLFMERNGVTSNKLKESEKTVQDAIKQTKYESRQLTEDMAQSIAGIIGSDAEDAVIVIRGLVENAIFASETIENGGTAALFTIDSVEKFFTNATSQALQKYTSPYGFARGIVDKVVDKYAKKNPWVKGALMLWDAGKFCYDAYQRYQKLLPIWERGFAAKAFLDDFYNRLNIYLDNVFKDRAKFILTVSGDKTRKFTFLGTKGNYQTWSVSFILKRERAYGNRKYSPAGEYRGSAAVKLSHYMGGFDAMLWNLPIGPLEEWWFVKATALILNGVQPVTGDYSGYSYISRIIESDNARLTVYSDEGNGSGYVWLKSSMDMSGFKDTIRTSSTQKATIDSSVGFADGGGNVAAAMYADIKMHLEGNEYGTFSLVLDKANAKFQSILGINVDEKQGTRVIAEVWDSNIWAPLQSKTAAFDIRGYILEEAMQ